MSVYLLLFVVRSWAGAFGIEAPDETDEGPTKPHDEPGTLPIVGGDDVADGDWPDAAAVYFGSGANSVGCTGVLVAPDVALTAGHCAGGITKVKLASNNYLQAEGEVIDVAEEYEYPSSWNNYDITALVLEEEATTEPRLIAIDCILDDYLYNGAPVAIVGYGAIDEWGNQYTSDLQEGFTEVTDYDCSHVNWGCNASVSPGGEIGAGGDGVDTCYGDSGGPMYLLTEKGDFLVGITSRAWNWVGAPCGEGGIYVRPDAVFDWIEETTGRTLPRYDCVNDPPEPTAPTLYTTKNTAGSVGIDPGDPDSDSFTFALIETPSHGTAEVKPDGNVIYTPEDGYKGNDSVVVEVTDDGNPPASGEVEIAIEVLSNSAYRKETGESAGCGCTSGTMPGTLGPWMAACAFVLRRSGASWGGARRYGGGERECDRCDDHVHIAHLRTRSFQPSLRLSEGLGGFFGPIGPLHHGSQASPFSLEKHASSRSCGQSLESEVDFRGDRGAKDDVGGLPSVQALESGGLVPHERRDSARVEEECHSGETGRS